MNALALRAMLRWVLRQMLPQENTNVLHAALRLESPLMLPKRSAFARSMLRRCCASHLPTDCCSRKPHYEQRCHLN